MDILKRDLRAALKIIQSADKEMKARFNRVLVEKGYLWASDNYRALKIPIGEWDETTARSYMTIEQVKEVLSRKGRPGTIQDVRGGRLYAASFNKNDATPMGEHKLDYPKLSSLFDKKGVRWTTFEKADRDALYKAIGAVRLRVVEFHCKGEGHEFELLYAHHSPNFSTGREELELNRALCIQLDKHSYNTRYFKAFEGLGFDRITFLGKGGTAKVRLRNSRSGKESILRGIELGSQSRHPDFSWE